jgi:hypothetical protein
MRHGVLSFTGEFASGFAWPDRGTVDLPEFVREALLGAVQLLPCDGTSLQWTDDATWVIFELFDARSGSSAAIADLREAIVAFRGGPREACSFLKGRGLPVPTTLPHVETAREWEAVSVGPRGFAIAGSNAKAKSEDHGLAFVVNGLAIAGDAGVAWSFFGEVEAGRAGVAISRSGRRAKAGDLGLAVVDEFGEAGSGQAGISIVDTGGVATSGARGIALAPNGGFAGVGEEGLAWSGQNGSASAGKEGIACAGEGGMRKPTLAGLSSCDGTTGSDRES